MSSATLAFIDRSGFGFLGSGLLCIAVGLLTYHDFFKCDYVQIRNHQEWTVSAGYTVAQFVALVIGTFMLPMGIIFLLIFAVQSSKNKWNDALKICTYALLCGGSALGVALSHSMAEDVLSCGIFCFGDDGVQREKNDAAVVAMGLIYFFVSIFFMVVFFCLTILAIFSQNAVEPPPTYMQPEDEKKPLLHNPTQSSAVNRAETQPVHAGPNKHVSVFVVFLTFAVVYPLLFFACMSLPTWWSYFTKYDIQEYQAAEPDKTYGFYWSIHLGGGAVLKLFPDILIFYAAIYIVSFVALISEAWSGLRVRLLSRPKIFGGYTVGEILLLTSLATLVLGQFCYWYYDHGWENSAITSRTSQERAARSVGQVANMVTGLLVLPASRNSVWSIVFGVSFEATIKYHQLLGYMLLGLVAAHAFLWWAVFVQQDTFPHDIFAVPTIYHQDNFTIPLAVVTAILMFVIMGGLAHWTVRRSNYDIFYWTHHFFMVVFLVMLWHSTMSWYYVSGGLLLWVVDHIIRLSRSVGHTVNVEKISIMGSGNIVCLGYKVSSTQSIFSGNNPFQRGEYGPLPHQMGQYCFINIPEIAQLAWHPFTISSAPGDAMTTHHIKAMGNEQWTGRLLFLARALQASPKAQINNVVVNIDGPYGIPLQTSRYRNILLVAGGVGITPLHACFKHIYQAHTGADRWSYAHIKKVRLVWVVRTLADASYLEDSLREIGQANQNHSRSQAADGFGGSGPLFSYSVFVTGSSPSGGYHDYSPSYPYGSDVAYKYASSGAGMGKDFKVKQGRPDLQSEILALSPWGMEALVFACGPPSMIDSCAKYSHASMVDFRHETFEL